MIFRVECGECRVKLKSAPLSTLNFPHFTKETFFMNISQNEYSNMVDKVSPKSKVFKNCINAFAVGGFICVVGQALTDTYQYALGMDIQNARCLTSISLIFLSALFTALSWYDNIAKFAGAGTLVPITGFANAVVSPAMEFRSEGYIGGLAAKMFVIAGPVIVYGTVASVIYGIIFFMLK